TAPTLTSPPTIVARPPLPPYRLAAASAPSTNTPPRTATLPAPDVTAIAPPNAARPAGCGPPLYGRASIASAPLTPRAPDTVTVDPGALMDWNLRLPPVTSATGPDGRPPTPCVEIAPPSVIELPMIVRPPPERAAPVPPWSEMAGEICTGPRDRITSERP